MVSTPTAKEILKNDNIMQQIHVAYGGARSESNSRFAVYAERVKDIGEVQSKYPHMKKRFLDATHVSMVYRLEGLNKAYDEGGADDLEHGITRRLLNVLTKENATSVVIFVIRFYGGTKIGAKRFEIATELTKEVIRLLQNNVMENSILTRPMMEYPSTVKARKNKPKISPRGSLAPKPIRGGPRSHGQFTPNARFFTPTYNRFRQLGFESPGDTTTESVSDSAADSYKKDDEPYVNYNPSEDLGDWTLPPPSMSSNSPLGMKMTEGTFENPTV